MQWNNRITKKTSPQAAPMTGLHLGLFIAAKLRGKLLKVSQCLNHSQLIDGVL